MPTILPLVGDLLAGYNNLPAIPENDPLGDIINQLYAIAFPSERIITVSQQGGLFQTIEDAIVAANALVPAPSVTSPVVIQVGPGTYPENNPLQVPEGLYIEAVESVGIGGSVIVVASDVTSPIFELQGNRCGIGGMFLTGANGAGGAGVRMNLPLATDSAFCQRVFVTDCSTGIVHDQGIGVYLSNQVLSTSAAMIRAIDVNAGQLLAVTNQFGGTPGNVCPIGLDISGASVVRVSGTNVQDVNLAWAITGGALVRVSSSAVTRCTTGFSVNASTLEADGVQVEDRPAPGLDLVVNAGSEVTWTGGRLAADRISIDPAAMSVIAAPTDREGGVDPSFSILAELSVGTETQGRESALGGGDSHQRGLIVFANDNGTVGTWTNLTADYLDPSIVSTMFPGVGVNNAWYVGGDVPFPNIKLDMDAAIALGAGAVSLEYWDGGAWVAFTNMQSDADDPFDQHGQTPFERANNNEQFRFDAAIETNWALLTLNGENKYWIRAIITSAITTSPTSSFVKLGTNRTEVNANGFTEAFGRAEPRRNLLVHQRLSDDLQGASPTNGNLPLTANISITPLDNQFVNGANDGFGEVFDIPEGLDTSRPIRFDVFYIPIGNGAGDIELQFTAGLIAVGDVLNGSVPDVTQNDIFANPGGLASTLQQATFFVDISAAVPGNFLAFSIRRDATGGNPNDTFANNIRVASIRACGDFWHL